ncbi:DUF2306 domain-containing protein [Archangium sp.]|uniref:DUF2306 domain-containing protein n=1 Tax=Archangium sp. TaxID=1872627 RepID=UPI002D373700|nr:DUF2306 domain-containing protein [Archangium sp.]HYO52886.1 DUF2306 domain-containing protein [Archangium sp.]
MSHTKIARMGRYVIFYLAFLGSFSALSPYVMPKAFYDQVMVMLYGNQIATEMIPKQFEWPIQNMIHRLGGTLYMVMGVLQFSKTFRARRPRVHRWVGRAFILLSFAAAISGVSMAYTHGMAGTVELVPSVVFGALMILATARAYLYARKREFARHREWMIRSFSIGLGIATIRILYMVGIATTSLTPTQLIGVTFWSGWLVTMAAGEWWIHQTRPARRHDVEAQPVLSQGA